MRSLQLAELLVLVVRVTVYTLLQPHLSLSLSPYGTNPTGVDCARPSAYHENSPRAGVQLECRYTHSYIRCSGRCSGNCACMDNTRISPLPIIEASTLYNGTVDSTYCTVLIAYTSTVLYILLENERSTFHISCWYLSVPSLCARRQMASAHSSGPAVHC